MRAHLAILPPSGPARAGAGGWPGVDRTNRSNPERMEPSRMQRQPPARSWPCLRLWPLASIVTLAFAAACQPEPPLAQAEPGEPLPGLTDARRAAFAEGFALFNRPFSAETGLGPLFNQDRCSSCHDLPTSGGHGAEPVTKVTRFDPVAGCSTLAEQGGDLLQASVTELARAAGLSPEDFPDGMTAITEMRAPAVYGLGLVAQIGEAAIRERADPDDADGDGISGRPNLDGQGRVGRFGRRAQHATLSGFIAEALLLEMGITSPSHPIDVTRNGIPVPAETDPAPDPEATAVQVQQLVDYIDLLAPPARRLPDDAGALADVQEGERIFAFAGCDACHTPTYRLEAFDDPVFAGVRFSLYSDLLLHDMGPELADICSPGTAPSEWKTARLVGLGLRNEFLHDGRAQRISSAIELHGGEAAASRDVFRRLTPQAREQLLAFLRSL